MLLGKNQQNEEYNVEFLLERPVGWSSACLDSTIDYFLSCSGDKAHEIKEVDSIEFQQENL